MKRLETARNVSTARNDVEHLRAEHKFSDSPIRSCIDEEQLTALSHSSLLSKMSHFGIPQTTSLQNRSALNVLAMASQQEYNPYFPLEFRQAPVIGSLSQLDAQSFPYDAFDNLYRSRWPASKPSQFVFSSFRLALQFGKRLAAARFGFQIRVKTTGVNKREGIVYKYICCRRQGLAEHGWKPKDGTKQRKRHSVRCNCAWSAKLIGMKVYLPRTQGSWPSLTDTDPDMVWWWDESGHNEHNHELDYDIVPFVRSPFSSPDQQPRTSAPSAQPLSAKPSPTGSSGSQSVYSPISPNYSSMRPSLVSLSQLAELAERRSSNGSSINSGPIRTQGLPSLTTAVLPKIQEAQRTQRGGFFSSNNQTNDEGPIRLPPLVNLPQPGKK